MTEFYSYGACQEVTGSKHFLDISGSLLQVDCGMFQGRREESYQKNRQWSFDPAEVKATILTHAHFDHSGALPIAVKNGFNGNIYSTSATRDVANIILLDSAYIQFKDHEYLKDKAARYPERRLTVYEPLYHADDVVKTMSQFVSLGYHRPFSPLPGVKAEFFNAGHIIGSAMVKVTLPDGRVIGFSGDLGRKNLPIIRDPESMGSLDYLILEGTYGNRKHKEPILAKEELADIIRQAVAKKSKIIIPAFTVERTQELIYLIHELILDKAVPEIPIFIDSPMAVNATAIFKVHPEYFDDQTRERFTANNLDPFGFDAIRYVTSVRESMQLNDFPPPVIIISASGMAESGRILHHLRNNIENPDNIIAIVGFMAEHTLGRKLVNREPQVKILGKNFRVKARIATLNAFSAHADYHETIEWLNTHDLKSLRKIFLVHGEKDALLNLRSLLLEQGVPEVEIVAEGQRYRLAE